MAVPTFCRHNRLEATCPICARKRTDGRRRLEPRRATPRPARSASAARAVRRAAAACKRAPHGARGRRRLRARAAARAAQLRRRGAAGRRARLRGGAPGRAVRPTRPASTPTWRARPTSRRPPGWPSSSPTCRPWRATTRGRRSRAARTTLGVGRAADARGRRARAARRARSRARRIDPAGLPRVGGARRLAGAGLHRRARVARQRRFDRAFERLSLPGFGRAPRFELLVVLGRLGRLRRAPVVAAALRRRARPDVVASKRVFGIGDPLLLQRRAARPRRPASASRSRRSTSRWPTGCAPRASASRPARRSARKRTPLRGAAIRAALRGETV